MIRFPLVLLLALALASCTTQTSVTLAGHEVAPIAVKTLRSWRADDNGKQVGFVDLIEIQSRPPVRMFQVSRPGGQVAGWIDMKLRAFRKEPFAGEKTIVKRSIRDRNSHEIVAEAAFCVRNARVLVAMDTMEEDLRVLLELRRQPRIIAIAPGAEARF